MLNRTCRLHMHIICVFNHWKPKPYAVLTCQINMFFCFGPMCHLWYILSDEASMKPTFSSLTRSVQNKFLLSDFWIFIWVVDHTWYLLNFRYKKGVDYTFNTTVLFLGIQFGKSCVYNWVGYHRKSYNLYQHTNSLNKRMVLWNSGVSKDIHRLGIVFLVLLHIHLYDAL